jgi:hypothetical protein
MRRIIKPNRPPEIRVIAAARRQECNPLMSRWTLAFLTAVLLWLLLTLTSVMAQTKRPLLRVDGEEKVSGVKIATTSELLIESQFTVKRVKILRKQYNDYKLESFVDVKPPSKNVGMILAVSANKIKSGDQIQLLLVPENETLKLSDEETTIYLNIE